ncbi:histone H3.3C [Camellia lanceoleosa]|uniref:Histone H3.3C n=1 Tax=Camellia lanceoleosa TaxID=1840588 RepID=A0ACC0HI82_9ERIC|nr:histone H3.3C [Camellia lanceoleosa]
MWPAYPRHQKSIELLILKLPFKRLVHEIAQDFKVREVRRQRKGNKGYFGLHKGGEERDGVPYLDRGEMMEESGGGRCSSEMAWAAEILRKGIAFLCSWISQEGRFNVLLGEPQRLFKPSQQGRTLIK